MLAAITLAAWSTGAVAATPQRGNPPAAAKRIARVLDGLQAYDVKDVPFNGQMWRCWAFDDATSPSGNPRTWQAKVCLLRPDQPKAPAVAPKKAKLKPAA